jgi:hypothetical protein
MSRNFALLLSAACLVFVTPPDRAGAGEISFEEFPASDANCCYVSEEYVSMGVHFHATDDGSIWTGISGGDPGGWGVEGTNGTSFLGFNGRSYSLAMSFDMEVSGVSVDVSRTAGSRPSDGFTLQGYRAGAMVEEAVVDMSGINEWLTVALSESVDEVRWIGTGSSPYAVDNLVWSGSDEVMEVPVDVHPGSADNSVNPKSGVVPVVLFGSAALSVEDVDIATLAFGPLGSRFAHKSGPHTGDHNGDGMADLMIHFLLPGSGLTSDHTEACVMGTTTDGRWFSGCDSVTPKPGKPENAEKAAKSGKPAKSGMPGN